MKNNRVLQFTLIANLAALSFLLYYFKFPLPFIFPSFLDIQFSNLPAIIGGFAMGPVVGSAIVVIRTLMKLPFSSTAMVGEFVDLLIGLATVVSSSVIYKKLHTKKGAIIAMGVGMIAWIVVAVAANYFFVIDFYIEYFWGGNLDPLLGMFSVIPGVTAENYLEKYIVYAAIPFNILLSGLVYFVTFLIYKRISHLIDDIAKKF
jgi:riboflavin transporter FmnP